MEWVECENSFFQQGPQFEYESGFFSVDDGKAKALAHPDALGISVSPNGHVVVVKVATAMFHAPGWTCHVYKVPLPSHDDMQLFEDDFAETEQAGADPCEWLRAGRGEGFSDEERLALYSTVSPDDLAQGGLGDCWLISAFATMAEYPEKLMQVIQQKALAPDGMYQVNLFSFAQQRFVQIQIDDRMPTVRGHSKYCQLSHQGELWPCLLEKAFAKHMGGYQHIQGGWSIFAFGAMTGCTDLLCINQSSDGETWGVKAPKWTQDVMLSAAWGPDLETRSSEDLLHLLAGYAHQNFLMCCGSSAGKDTEMSAQGIVQGHAYSLLGVVENVAGTGIDLVQLRNPWGHQEWSGDWSDKSELWEENPEIAQQLGHKTGDDGMFWMAWEDFCTNYKAIFVCRQDMGKNRGKKTREAQMAIDASGGDDDEHPERISPGVHQNRKLNGSIWARMVSWLGPPTC